MCRLDDAHEGSHTCACSYTWWDHTCRESAVGKRTGRLRYRVRVDTHGLILFTKSSDYIVRDYVTDDGTQRRTVASDARAFDVVDLISTPLGYRLVRGFALLNEGDYRRGVWSDLHPPSP